MLVLFAFPFTRAAELARHLETPEAPPPAEPHIFRSGFTQSSAAPPEFYTIGDPTPEEQLYLEMINRSRANPFAEALLFYHTNDPAVRSSYDNSRWVVDLVAMTNQFAAIPPAPPLAMNAQLLAAARKHSQDMFQNVFQGHTSSDGRTLADRVLAEDYSYERLAENVYSFAKSVFHGHAGFDVDWGPGNDGTGMQTPPGHRNSIHNPNFTEVGIGVVLGTKADPLAQRPTVGPQLVTQDFGAQLSKRPFITGVAYFDLNGNQFYDPGEGIGGLQVTAEGLSTGALTARSGGYALPVPGDGTYTITISGPHLPPATRFATISGGRNQKLDFNPAYLAPSISGPPRPLTNQTNLYTFAAIPGATNYEWRQFQSRPALVEPAENTSNVVVQKSGAYDVLNTDLTASGAGSFRLLHLSPPQYQSVTLKPSWLLSSEATLSFQSRLGVATSDQVAEVQISLDEGRTWSTIYAQAGGSPEIAFQPRQIPLSSYAGKTAQFRFRFRFDSGLYNPSTQSGVGWYFDDILVQNAEEILSASAIVTSEARLAFVPISEGNTGLQVRARAGHEFLEWGPPLHLDAWPGPPRVQIRRLTPLSSAVRLELEFLSGTSPISYIIETRADFSAPWTVEREVILPSQSSPPSLFVVDVPLSRHHRRFYRVQPRF